MNKATLGEKMQQRSTNINIMRFVAALGVLVAHAHVLSDGSQDWLMGLTGQVTWGALAVDFFFFVSGLYVAKSLCRCANGRKYFAARSLRIFPLLGCVVLFTVFVFGPLASTMGVGSYFLNLNTWKYLLNIILLPVHYLPGVFENCQSMATVNGSLWTLSVEFLCYIGLFFLYKLKFFEKRKCGLFGVGVLLGGTAGYYVGIRMGSSVILSALQPTILFFVGALCYALRDKIVLDMKFGIAAVVVWIFCIFSKFAFWGNVFCLPVIIMVFLIGNRQMKGKAVHMGDWSYAMYLTAFPVQQAVVSANGGTMNPYVNILVSIPIVIFLSMLLCRLEKRVLALYERRCQ